MSEAPAEDPYQVRWGEHAQHLVDAASENAQWYASVAAHLVDPQDRLAIDVGCGGAGMAAALAGVLSGGRVLAVDGDQEVLDAARANLPHTGVPVDFVRADMDGDLSDVAEALGAPADLAWASASVHHAGDQQRAVDKLAGLLAPGGRLALAEGGLPLRSLPWDLGIGPPGLEQRLDAAQERWFVQMREHLPGSVRMPYGWTQALQRAGLTTAYTRSWLQETPTPLSTQDRDRVVHDLAHRVERLRPTGLLEPDDLSAWDRLLDESDPAWLGNREDLYRLTARSVHVATKP